MKSKEYQEIYDNTPIYENIADPKRKEAPKTCGLYLIGNTIFNPFSNNRFYLVKVGLSTNLYNRMKAYRTMNPFIFHIDYKEIDKEEVYKAETSCHIKLSKKALSRSDDADEWFILSRQNYKKICEKGFSFFF